MRRCIFAAVSNCYRVSATHRTIASGSAFRTPSLRLFSCSAEEMSFHRARKALREASKKHVVGCDLAYRVVGPFVLVGRVRVV